MIGWLGTLKLLAGKVTLSSTFSNKNSCYFNITKIERLVKVASHSSICPAPSMRTSRQIKLRGFNFTVKYKPGSTNPCVYGSCHPQPPTKLFKARKGNNLFSGTRI